MSDNDLTLITDAIRKAGNAIMAYYRPGETVSSDAEVRHKSPDNPLTKADLEADRILHEILTQARPDYGWLSEETTDDASRLSKDRVWVVDPIDGTKEYIMGIPQFAVSVGLVENGLPIAAAVYNPAADELFSAARGQGITLNGKPIHTSSREELFGATCLASRSETKRGEWDQFKDELKVSTMGSIAYKLAVVACGRLDMTFTLTPKNEWDFCAGTLLVEEAGGQVTHKDGSPVSFNRTNPKVRSLLATNGPLHQPLLDRLVDVPLSIDRHALAAAEKAKAAGSES
ncbi:MAG: 3'(2'),5'-bisphosphate nucleotidase CysQ [Magnetococcales bacterium]|nr:3'(2'),5'-bisphosphate nucleotidase CysQ [Magnetococcales bacterium]